MLSTLLPSFRSLASFAPAAHALARRHHRDAAARAPGAAAFRGGTAEDESAGEAAHAYLEAGEQEGLIEREERRLIESIVDFGDTLVREVMTPRPDIIAVRADATLGEVRQRVRASSSTRAFPSTATRSITSLGFVFVKDLIRLPIDCRRRARRSAAAASGALRA